jgi:hypothetical protein
MHAESTDARSVTDPWTGRGGRRREAFAGSFWRTVPRPRVSSGAVIGIRRHRGGAGRARYAVGVVLLGAGVALVGCALRVFLLG